MIQRIQTVFLLLVALCSALGLVLYCELFFGLYEYEVVDKTLGFIIFITFVSIFSFKNRKRQIGVNLGSLILNILLIGFLVYVLLNLSGGFSPEKGIGLLVPFINIVLLLLANFYIRKDEKLVKSVDRFR